MRPFLFQVCGFTREASEENMGGIPKHVGHFRFCFRQEDQKQAAPPQRSFASRQVPIPGVIDPTRRVCSTPSFTCARMRHIMTKLTRLNKGGGHPVKRRTRRRPNDQIGLDFNAERLQLRPAFN